MKKLLALLVLVISLSGCATWNTLKTDYLHADEYDEFTWSDAWNTFKMDYLKLYG